MVELNVQKFLRCQSGDPIKSLHAAYSIKSRRHEDFPNLVCLKYSQLESPFHEPIVQECRGIILDELNDWKVVSYPFDKFFNYGETNAADIDWSSAYYQSKLDGSLMTLYFYNEQWRVQSSGTPDASGSVSDFGFTFKELFWNTFDLLGYYLNSFERNYCYMFELQTPVNRVVVEHEEPSLTLIGVRNLKTFEEEHVSTYADENWFEDDPVDYVLPHSFSDVKHLVTKANNLNPIEQEGYIVVDKDFNRIKIKSNKYVQLSHFREGVTSKKLL